MKIALIPCGATEWRQEGRLMGRVELSMTPAGEEECIRWAEALRPLGLKRIFHSEDELATRTAALLVEQLGVPHKKSADVAEVDFGLWTGLTDADLEGRYPSVHHELTEAPLNVAPPEGESLLAAAERLRARLKKWRRSYKNEAVGLVLRPVLLALARCELEPRALSELWETARQTSEPVVVAYKEAPNAGANGQAPLNSE